MDPALSWLEQSAAAGWRPGLEWWNTPIHEILAGNDRYQKLTENLKADVDGQRKRAQAMQLLLTTRIEPTR
jgi:hypothetical protein